VAHALRVPARAEEAWRQRLDDLGRPLGGIVIGHGGGPVLVGLRDSGDIEIRLYVD
jgi:hypothetical protein